MTSTSLVRCPARFAKGTTTLRDPFVGRIPKVARLLALALRCERLFQERKLENAAELARLGHITRARATQILNLTLLAPDIQERILFLPPVERGRDPLTLAQLQPLALEPDWRQQRWLWCRLEQAMSRKVKTV